MEECFCFKQYGLILLYLELFQHLHGVGVHALCLESTAVVQVQQRQHTLEGQWTHYSNAPPSGTSFSSIFYILQCTFMATAGHFWKSASVFWE